MKKSNIVKLVLVSSLLVACSKKEKRQDQEVYMRGDDSAPYSQVQHSQGNSNALLWYLAFRPYGSYSGGNYHSSGMYSNSISERSNVGHNSFKSSSVRGSSSFHSSYSSHGISSRGGFGSSGHFSSGS